MAEILPLTPEEAASDEHIFDRKLCASAKEMAYFRIAAIGRTGLFEDKGDAIFCLDEETAEQVYDGEPVYMSLNRALVAYYLGLLDDYTSSDEMQEYVDLGPDADPEQVKEEMKQLAENIKFENLVFEGTRDMIYLELVANGNYIKKQQ